MDLSKKKYALPLKIFFHFVDISLSVYERVLCDRF